MLEDALWVIKSHTLKRTDNTMTKRKYTKGQTILSPKENIQKDKQYYHQKKIYKRTNKDPQNTTQKTKDRATRTPLKTGKSYQFLLQ
jgi:hypothetical protein